jgi:hypothetical protein
MPGKRSGWRDGCSGQAWPRRPREGIAGGVTGLPGATLAPERPERPAGWARSAGQDGGARSRRLSSPAGVWCGRAVSPLLRQRLKVAGKPGTGPRRRFSGVAQASARPRPKKSRQSWRPERCREGVAPRELTGAGNAAASRSRRSTFSPATPPPAAPEKKDPALGPGEDVRGAPNDFRHGGLTKAVGPSCANGSARCLRRLSFRPGARTGGI